MCFNSKFCVLTSNCSVPKSVSVNSFVWMNSGTSEGENTCWTESKEEWQGEITVQSSCSFINVSVPIPPIFNLTEKENVLFTISINNFTFTKYTDNDCNDTGEIGVRT